jgi:hypothetical protein
MPTSLTAPDLLAYAKRRLASLAKEAQACVDAAAAAPGAAENLRRATQIDLTHRRGDALYELVSLCGELGAHDVSDQLAQHIEAFATRCIDLAYTTRMASIPRAHATPPACATCNGQGRYRPPYSLGVTACPDCLTRPISTASATTSAPVNAPGSSA